MKEKTLLTLCLTIGWATVVLGDTPADLGKKASTALLHDNYRRAAALCTKALQQPNVNVIPFLQMRALARQSLKDSDGAIDDCNAVLSREKNLPLAYLIRGEADEALGHHKQAIRDCSAALRLKPKLLYAYTTRAAAYWFLGDFAKATADTRRAIPLMSKKAPGYYNLGQCYQDSGKTLLALHNYRRAVALDRNYESAYSALWMIYRSLGNTKGAFINAEIAAKLPAHDAVDYIGRGECRKYLGEYKLALKDFQQVLRLRPFDGTGYNEQARILATCPEQRFRDGKRAVTLARKACEVARWQLWRGLDTLAAAYAETGDFTRAVNYQTQALRQRRLATRLEVEGMRRRLDLYRAHQAYRQTPATQ